MTSVALLDQMLMDHVTRSHMLQKRQQVEARVTPKPRDSEGLRRCVRVVHCAQARAICAPLRSGLQQLHGPSHVLQCDACGNVVSAAKPSS